MGYMKKHCHENNFFVELQPLSTELLICALGMRSTTPGLSFWSRTRNDSSDLKICCCCCCCIVVLGPR